MADETKTPVIPDINLIKPAKLTLSQLNNEKEGTLAAGMSLIGAGVYVILHRVYAGISCDQQCLFELIAGAAIVCFGFVVLKFRGYLKFMRWSHAEIKHNNPIIYRTILKSEMKNNTSKTVSANGKSDTNIPDLSCDTTNGTASGTVNITLPAKTEDVNEHEEADTEA